MVKYLVFNYFKLLSLSKKIKIATASSTKYLPQTNYYMQVMKVIKY